MELVAILFSAASLATNLYVVKLWRDHVKQTQLFESELQEFIPETVSELEPDCQCMDCPRGRTHEATVPEVSVAVLPDESSQAWRNIKEEQPESVPSISPSQPAPKPGPLQRPGGFYR